MTFDLCATDENGFSCNSFAWRPIAFLMFASGALTDKTAYKSISVNGGYFVDASCASRVADFLERLLTDYPFDMLLMPSPDLGMGPDGRIEGASTLTREMLSKFIEFCRNCGEGFEIW